MHRMYVDFVHYKFLIFYWMKSPCSWHTLWLLQCHLMKQLECADTISGVNADRHIFFCNPWTGLWGFQLGGAPRCQDSWHMKVTMVSALWIGHLYPQGNIPDTHFCYTLSWLLGHSVVGGLWEQKIPMIPSGIKPVTFQVVAWCLNQLHHREPQQTHITQFTLVSTHCGMDSFDRYKFCTRSELHNSKHRTHNESLEKCP